MNHIIASVAAHSAAVKEFQIRRKDGAPLPDWQPGAHIVLRFTAADGSTFENHYSWSVRRAQRTSTASPCSARNTAKAARAACTTSSAPAAKSR